jgi:hypothetical protein
LEILGRLLNVEENITMKTMKTNRRQSLGLALLGALALSRAAQAQQPPVIKLAPPDLNLIRAEILKSKYQFTVGDTGILDRDIKDLTGLVVPDDIAQIARAQGPLARKILDLDKLERTKAIQLDPSLRTKIYEFNIVANPGMNRWDWRTRNKVTPVKNQNPAGTCWAFSCMGAMESSILIRSNVTTDISEQFMVSYSGAGTISGGYLDRANNWLTVSGTTSEAVCPYNATNSTSTPATTPTPYDALAWSFVEPSGGTPSVQAIKEALCEHGPLETAVYADTNFKVYSGGIFDHVDNSHNVNHAVIIVGWDDAKNSWIIKNSWGTRWGETCGGSEKGYMYIKYGTHKVGQLTAWVKAKSVFYTINPKLLKDLRINPKIKFNPGVIR